MTQKELTPASNLFQNRGLFSDHFLQERLPEWKEWNVNKELDQFRNDLLALYEAKKQFLPGINEAQMEEEFIKPVLDLLGYANSYIVQASTKIGQQTNRPDYALFPDASTKDKAYAKIESNDYTQCIGIADAKYWGEFMENYVEPTFWKWWRQKEAAKRASVQGVIKPMQAGIPTAEEAQPVEMRDVSPGPQVYLINCWRCGGQIAWRLDLGPRGGCPYCGAWLQLTV